MRLHRGGWIWATSLVLATAVAPNAFAQPSFGPDPFRPYLNQYDPYVYPMGPASPMAGGGEGMIRPGFRSANQFQDYLEGLSGPGRLTTDRAGIGMPYYRSSVDGTWGGSGSRDYQPNVRSTPTFEQTQRRVTDRYFAYFSERDPKTRAVLLKEYRQARRDASRVLSSGTPSPTEVLNSASGTRPRSGAMRTGRSADDQPSSSLRSGRFDDSDRGRRTSSRSAPPPPSIPSIGSSRASGRSRSTPTRVLDRAGSMDDRNTRASGSTSTTPRRRRTAPPLSPPPSDTP
jgi:hypothetical protein